MLLHWVFKIGSLQKNVAFYNSLGMRVLRHEEFSSGCEAQCNGAYSRPWSKTMVGYGGEQENFVFELTFNYGIKSYKRGNDFKYAIIGYNNPKELYERVRLAGFEGDQLSGEDSEDFIVYSPDGYPFKIIHKDQMNKPKALGVSLNVNSIQSAVDYYVNIVQLSVVENNGKIAKLCYTHNNSNSDTYLELYGTTTTIDHGEAYGRIAIAVDGDQLEAREKLIRELNEKIHTPYVSLPTPGKADVQVVILIDRDGYEICLVGAKGFFELCQPFDGCDVVDYKKRIEMGSGEKWVMQK